MRLQWRKRTEKARSLIVATQSLRTAGYENEGKHLLPRCFPTIRKNQLCGTWIIPQIMSVRNRIRYFFFPFFQINTIIRQFGSVMPFSFCNLRKIQSGKVSIFQKYHWQTFVLMLSCESWQEILPTTKYSEAHHEKEMKERCDREMAAALLLVLFRRNMGVGPQSQTTE